MSEAQRLCAFEDIPEGGAKGFQRAQQKIVLLKKRGKIYAYRNACPHLGIPLEWVDDQFLDSSQSMIQCANHGALFVIETGKCVSGPCSGQKLQAINCQIIEGDVYLS